MTSTPSRHLFPECGTWYLSERNTANLVQAVFSSLDRRRLTGTDVWNLCRLTWITKADDHWKSVKVPALAELFGQSPNANLSGSLDYAVLALDLPPNVARSAVRPTGIVNLYNSFRNSALDWCDRNAERLLELVNDAYSLGTDDGVRIDLAIRIEALGRIPTPNGAKSLKASGLLTPLIACLDRHLRFPIVNGRVESLLPEFGADLCLQSQVRYLLQRIDALKTNALQLDAMIVYELLGPGDLESGTFSTGTDLRRLDESLSFFEQQDGPIERGATHNKITNRLLDLFKDFKPKQGDTRDGRYDVRIPNYDGLGHDLLIEAKPDESRESIRMAIGQLFDYRRSVPIPSMTHLAVLTPNEPDASYIALLGDLGINGLWFGDRDWSALEGKGPNLPLKLRTPLR